MAKKQNKSEILRQQKKQQQKEENKIKNRKIKRKKTLKKVVVTAVSVLGASAVIYGGYWLFALERPWYRSKVAMSSDHFSINPYQLAFYVNDTYENMKATYSDSLESAGLDTSKSLRSQTMDNGTNWFDYMLNTASSNLKTALVFSEYALEQGFSLDEEQKKLFDEVMETVDYDNVRGVKQSDARHVIELLLNTNYLYEDLFNSFSADDSECEAYYEENKSSFLTWDQLSYSFPYGEDAGRTKEEATELANELASQKTEEEFRQWILDYMTEIGVSEENINSTMEKLLHEDTKSEELGVAVMNWAEESDAYATMVLPVEDASLVGVLMLITPASRNETVDVNVRHILFNFANYETESDAERDANVALSEFLASDMSEESFGEIATKYTDDTGSAENGGLYEGVYPGEMVTEFDAWCFDENRKVGDYDIIKTQYGYHVMYFSGWTVPDWKAQAQNAVQTRKYNEWMESMIEKYHVSVDDGICQNIPED